MILPLSELGFLRRAAPFLAVFLCSLCAVATGQSPNESTSSFGDELTIGVLQDREHSLNPFEIRSTFQKNIVELIYGRGLLDQSNNANRANSRSGTMVARPLGNDNLQWRLVLDRNINFHHDVNIRNIDVQFTIELLQSNSGFVLNRQFDFKNVARVRGSGDLEVIFDLLTPDDEFGRKLAGVAILPNSYYAGMSTNGYELFGEKRPIGMGPFKFEYETDRVIQLRNNPYYFQGRPFLDGVKIRFYEDQAALVDALINRNVDYIEFPDRATARAVHDLMGDQIVVFLVPRQERRVFTLLFNMNVYPLSEPEVRRAIFLALNRQEIVNRFMHDIGRVAHTLITEDNPHFDETQLGDQYKPAQALKMLQNAGWRLNKQTNIMEKGGKPLSVELQFSRNSEFEAGVARAILTQLSELNINVIPLPVLPRSKHDILESGGYEAMIYDYTYDPEHLLEAFEQFYGKILGAEHETPNYTNRYLTRLLELTRDNQRPEKNLYQRFQTFLVQQRPVIFLFFDERAIIGIDHRFRDFRTTYEDGNRTVARLKPIEDWYVPKELQRP